MNLNQVDNKLLKEADEYIRKHRLIELFEVLKGVLICLGFNNCGGV